MRHPRLPALLLLLAITHCRCSEQDLDKDLPKLKTPVAPLDFGPVRQGSMADGVVHIENAGGGKLEVTASFAENASHDLTLVTTSLVLGSLESGDLQVHFAPSDPGEDEAVLTLVTNDDLNSRMQVVIHGGPIAGVLEAHPSPLTFPNATAFTETAAITLTNAGDAVLHLRSVGVEPGGNPDFSVTPLTGEVVLAPTESHRVLVTYARTTRDTPGHLLALSDDPAHPTLRVDLIASPVGRCGDRSDNDMDGLTDYPDDPGCTDVNDADETDPPACLDGATIRCGSDQGACTAGTRTCGAGHFGACEGAVEPSVERCDGLDDDCDGQTDEFLDCEPTSSSSASSVSSVSSSSRASSGPAPSSSTSVMGSSSSAPQCTMPEQCANIVDNSAGCYQVDCIQGSCSATLRHDSTSWVVSPRLSPEILVGTAMKPLRAQWDGQNFLVAMAASSGQYSARRVSPASVTLEPSPFLLPTGFWDLEWGGDHYLVTVNLPGSGDFNNPPVDDYVGVVSMSATGAVLSQPVPVLEAGSGCATPGAMGGEIAYSENQFLVVGNYKGCFGLLLATVNPANNGLQGTSRIAVDHVPASPALAARPGGFAMIWIEQRIGGGLTEGYAALVEPNASALYERNVDPFEDFAACCGGALNLLWGTRNFLWTTNRHAQHYEIMSSTLITGRNMMPPHPSVGELGSWPPVKGSELGFDGTNFLAITSFGDENLSAVRFNEDGLALDATPFPISPGPDGMEDFPALASDGHGRYLLAYEKADHNSYVRVFSTCP